MKKTVKKVGSVKVKGSLAKTLYKVTLKLLGKTYTQSGVSVSEALNKFEIRNVKGVRGIMIVDNGGNVKERILQPMQMTRLLNSHGLMKEVNIKNVSSLFQGI